MNLHKNSVLSVDKRMDLLLNRFELDNHMELMNKIKANMLSDLSKDTGLDKQDIFEDYLSLNEFNPIREILKREGKLFDEQSIVITIHEKK